MASTTLPALARDRNAGDVWIDTVGQPAGPGHEHDPHLPCAGLNLWGAGVADAAGTFTIDSWPPSGGRQQAYPSATASASWQSSGGRVPHVVATVSVQVLIASAVAAGAHATAQGFHFKLHFRQDPQKHETFWVRCPQPAAPSAGGGGSSSGGGTSSGGGNAGGGGTPGGGGNPGEGGGSNGGGTTGGGSSGTGGTPGGGPSGNPGQPSGGTSTISAGSSRSTPLVGSLAQTGRPLAAQPGPYLPGLPVVVLGLMIAVRPRRRGRQVTRTRVRAAGE